MGVVINHMVLNMADVLEEDFGKTREAMLIYFGRSESR
jgi:hypothetical protein